MKLSPGSTSWLEKLPTTVPTGWFSATLEAESESPVGASLTQLTLTATVPVEPPVIV